VGSSPITGTISTFVVSRSSDDSHSVSERVKWQIEKELTPFKARPHWGKLFTTSPAELNSIYNRMPDFIELSKKYDPRGKFRNDFLNTNIFNS
jgi:xylitol oxidase